MNWTDIFRRCLQGDGRTLVVGSTPTRSPRSASWSLRGILHYAELQVTIILDSSIMGNHIIVSAYRTFSSSCCFFDPGHSGRATGSARAKLVLVQSLWKLTTRSICSRVVVKSTNKKNVLEGDDLLTRQLIELRVSCLSQNATQLFVSHIWRRVLHPWFDEMVCWSPLLPALTLPILELNPTNEVSM